MQEDEEDYFLSLIKARRKLCPYLALYGVGGGLVHPDFSESIGARTKMGKGTFQPPPCSPLFPSIHLNFCYFLFEGQDFLLLILSGDKSLLLGAAGPLSACGPFPSFPCQDPLRGKAASWGGGQAKPSGLRAGSDSAKGFRASPLNRKGLGAWVTRDETS